MAVQKENTVRWSTACHALTVSVCVCVWPGRSNKHTQTTCVDVNCAALCLMISQPGAVQHLKLCEWVEKGTENHIMVIRENTNN